MNNHLNIKLAWVMALVFTGLMNLHAQQEPQYTQFMYNKLPLNAGYTGAREVLSLRALYRNQWTGIKGAPQTTTFSIHSPFKKESSAMGFFLVNDRLGVTNQTWFDVTYAYRVPLGKGIKLSIGINAGMLWYKSNLTELKTFASNDPVFQNNVSRVLPDIGAGLYLYHKHFYFGASVPNFFKGDLHNKDVLDQYGNDPSGTFMSARRTAHLFIMAGGVIKTGEVMMIRPQVIYKYIADADQKIPHQLDMNISLLIYNRVNIGGTYRAAFHNKKTGLENGDSFDVLLEVWPTKQMMIGFSYDYTLSKLGDYNKGSYELILGYDFNFEKKKVVTPRYF